ncbi:MAG: AraC-like DNA-binding protein [Halieaceae bacterium]|jgi:AraC-like DNA-binding protein
MNNNGMASVPAIKQYLKAAEANGVDCCPLLDRAGIDPAVLNDNNKRISGTAMERLVVLLVAASEDPCLGLHSSRFVEPATYSVLGYISMNCSTLREVLAKIPIYEKIVGDMGVSSTDSLGDRVLLRWQCQFQDPIAKRHEVETVIASWNAYTRNFLHVEASYADGIWFEHSEPDDPSLLAEYADIFACEVLFNQPASGILMRQTVLDEPLPQANQILLHSLLDHATQMLANIDRNQPLATQVKNLLRLMLVEHSPSSTLIAEKLGMSGRTLQRKLQEEGLAYKDVLNELRLELALHYLKNSQLSLDNIANKLGYAESRSFYRSFKQWTGHTAGSYRSEESL